MVDTSSSMNEERPLSSSLSSSEAEYKAVSSPPESHTLYCTAIASLLGLAQSSLSLSLPSTGPGSPVSSCCLRMSPSTIDCAKAGTLWVCSNSLHASTADWPSLSNSSSLPWGQGMYSNNRAKQLCSLPRLIGAYGTRWTTLAFACAVNWVDPFKVVKDFELVTQPLNGSTENKGGSKSRFRCSDFRVSSNDVKNEKNETLHSRYLANWSNANLE